MSKINFQACSFFAGRIDRFIIETHWRCWTNEAVCGGIWRGADRAAYRSFFEAAARGATNGPRILNASDLDRHGKTFLAAYGTLCSEGGKLLAEYVQTGGQRSLKKPRLDLVSTYWANFTVKRITEIANEFSKFPSGEEVAIEEIVGRLHRSLMCKTSGRARTDLGYKTRVTSVRPIPGVVSEKNTKAIFARA